MGYILLWVESIAAALLLEAATLSGAARQQPRWVRSILAFVPCLAALVVAGVFAFIAWYIEVALLMPHHLLEATFAWSLTIAFGVLALVLVGWRRQGDPLVLRAATWPAGKLTAAGAVALGLFVATFWNMDNAIRIQLASLRAEAGTMVLGAAPVRVPDHENAARLYQQAFEAMTGRELPPEPWLSKIYERTKTPLVLDWNDPALAKYLRERAAELELLRRASDRPSCQFEREYGRFDTVLTEVQQFRQGARDLALDARFRIAHGDTATALANVAVILKMARHVSSEPIVIAVLVGSALEGIGMETLGQVLERSTPAPRDFAVFKNLEPVSYRTAMQRALQVEHAAGLSSFVMLAEGDFHQLIEMEGASGSNEGTEIVATALSPFWRLFLLQTDLASYRERMRQLSALCSQPHFESLQRQEHLHDQWRHDRGGIVTGTLVPSLLKLTTATAQADARRRLTLLGVAAAEYRALQGKYPARLDELVPKYASLVPVDPFAGKPLKMVSRDSGVLLYSIGPDGADDGGQDMETKHGRQMGDIVLRLGPTPPAAEGPMPPAP
jgi:hypothetical protein